MVAGIEILFPDFSQLFFYFFFVPDRESKGNKFAAFFFVQTFGRRSKRGISIGNWVFGSVRNKGHKYNKRQLLTAPAGIAVFANL